MIDNNKIEILLNSFYEGSTTQEEEKILREYFATSNDIPEHLEADRQLFINLVEDRPCNIPNEFETRLENFIDSFEEKKVKRVNWKWVSSVAASIIIAVSVSVVYFNNDNNHKNERKDTYTDVDQAYNETERALLLIAETLNKGEAQYAKAQVKIEDLNEKINKNLNR